MTSSDTMANLMQLQMYPSMDSQITYSDTEKIYGNPLNLNHYIQCQLVLEQYSEIQKHRESNSVPTHMESTLTLQPKSTSFVYRPRIPSSLKLDLRHFNQIITINPTNLEAHVQGMCTFYDLFTACVPLEVMPKIVPELRGITVGGAYVGVGVESRSWLDGLFHETVSEIEVLIGNGKIVRCSPTTYPDLFYGMVNSYGTLGYILSMRIQLMKIKPYVDVTYLHFSEPHKFFEKIKDICNNSGSTGNMDFVDGLISSADHQTLVVGKLVDNPSYLMAPNYVTDAIYYKSIQNKTSETSETFTITDYVWRWDRDSFWSTTGTIMESWIVRKTFGFYFLRTDRLIGFRKWFSLPPQTEELIQDIGIPLNRCTEFFKWYNEEINMYPIFICPIKPNGGNCPLWKTPRNQMYCDFGFFGRKSSPSLDPNYYNKLIENHIMSLGGIKSLYSKTFYDKDTFEGLYYGGDSYLKLKDTYDTNHILPMLYNKVCNISS